MIEHYKMKVVLDTCIGLMLRGFDSCLCVLSKQFIYFKMGRSIGIALHYEEKGVPHHISLQGCA